MKNLKTMLVLGVVLAALSLMAETETVDGYTWTYRTSGSGVEIFNNNSVAVSPQPTGSLMIPSILGGKPVISIGRFAFGGCSKMTHVFLPSSILSIGEAAFFRTGLVGIVIPAGVSTIGDYSFAMCDNLKKVIIPHTVTTVGNAVFHMCGSLEYVSICNGVLEIGDQAFYRCGLTAVTIPRSVRTIGNEAFWSCSGLKTVTFKGDPPRMGTTVFKGVNSSCVAVVSKESTGWGVGEGCVWNGIKLRYSEGSGLDAGNDDPIAQAIMSAAVTALDSVDPNDIDVSLTAFTEIMIPDGATSIGSMAYCYCSELRKVVIPDSIARVENAAFGGCGDLSCVVFEGNAPTLGHDAFSNVADGCVAIVHKNSSGWGVAEGELWNG